jgi:hypothetical protein
VPVAYSQYAAINAVDFITGAWDYLVIGVREDIRFRIDPSGTIADDAGKVLVSGFQDNVVPCKIWARFGCTIIKPVTPRVPAGAIPFAKTRLLGLVAPDPPAGEAGERSSAKKAA